MKKEDSPLTNPVPINIMPNTDLKVVRHDDSKNSVMMTEDSVDSYNKNSK